MTDLAIAATEPEASAPAPTHRPKLDEPAHPRSVFAFFVVLALGLFFVAYNLYVDVSGSGVRATSWFPFVLLGVALLVALGFEFVNGFHDTANAVATVIYTHALPAPVAVLWSGFFNFLGVMVSSGAVAFGIVSLLPVELILHVGSGAGFAMVFALLIAAIMWNLGTWYLGLPASSSHTLIGSIIGVGLANQLLSPSASGVDWGQASKVGVSLLVSPLVGFVCSALLLLALKRFAKKPELYGEPTGSKPQPPFIRGTLIATCTGVSFAHGSNDGQKGMGLIMLILIGVVPTAYALNRALPDSEIPPFLAMSGQVTQAIERHTGGREIADPRAVLGGYLRTHTPSPDVLPAVAGLAGDIKTQVQHYGSLRQLPAAKVQNVRNDMYLVAEAIPRLMKDPTAGLDKDDAALLAAYRKELEHSTRFIPLWVKIAVAIALGLGTMIGWKRIVVTVGEKIGKSHLSYAQGMSAELVAATTIAAADVFGLPVSTTHVLSSGVAGTMAANRSGLQGSTVRNLVMAWVLTLPVAILLSGGLYLVFSKMFANMPSTAQAPEPVAAVAPASAVGGASGGIRIAGSSTILPVSQGVGAEFERQNPGARVSVEGAGTGAGLTRLCAGELDVADASRPINANESAACKANDVGFIELPLGFDGVSVVASKDNAFLECLTLPELRKLWQPEADHQVTHWDQVRSSFPAEPLTLFGPGPGSGTYDYFTLAIVGTEGKSRADYAQNDDGNVNADAVAKNKDALGYLGFAYYRTHTSTLKLVSVDEGHGCVAPDEQSITDGRYGQLARPLFLYVATKAAARPVVKEFIRLYLGAVGSERMRAVGYLPLSATALAAGLARFEAGQVGSVLGGHGAVVGVRPEAFGNEEERVQSSLVQ
jgi:inorganic phosphate transporter, PiT family